ncbi:MAG TPA: VOC family protein [Dehalococcoidia bacterium]|nr:VOC family protein [Dehalococcoidia bacterium]
MPAPQTFGAHHLTLTVTDLDRSIEFYTTVVGLSLVTRSADRALLHDGTLGVVLTPPGRELSDAERRFDEFRVGLDHLGFRVASPEDVDRAAEHLTAMGIDHSGVKPGRPPGSRLVAFRDPDNIQLEFYYAP